MDIFSITNFAQLFEHITEIYGTRNALHWKEGNDYKSITGKKLKELVYITANALKDLGLKAGDMAAIISESRYEWVTADFACIVNGIITVPIYTTMTSSQIKYILQHSEAKVCFVSNQYLAEKVKEIMNNLPGLCSIITFNKIEGESEKIKDFQKLIYQTILQSKEGYNEEKADRFFTECSSKINENEVLTIIYTSGTTGIPKGVCLSHKNILSDIRGCQKAFELNTTDRFLSYLPLAHSYERATGYYFGIYTGAEIYYAQNIDTLTAQFVEVKPTIFTSVPFLFTRLHSRLMKSFETLPARKRAMVKTAFKIARRYRNNKNHFLWKLADRMVFKEIRARTGGRARYIISGGSALNQEVAEFLDSIGITIYEGYGLTETSPVISVNRVGRNKFGTVGIPLDGVKVKIADDGEILVRGNTVMLGYFKNEEATKEVLVDGWFHTGDIGSIDEDGFLKIIDRKKSLIKTEGGEYISLTHIEDTLCTSKYIEQAIAFASDEKPFVTALIVPGFSEIEHYADSNDISFEDDIDLIQKQEIIKLIDTEVKKVQKDQAKFEQVRKFTIMPKSLTIENGELTPTLKIKRKVVEEKYKDVIDQMYRIR
jgi:long-chain acyl-CoA synthetase